MTDTGRGILITNISKKRCKTLFSMCSRSKWTIPMEVMTMTDIEIRALLGDMRAQEECTRKRILLPCWRCGGEAEVKQVSTVGRPLFAVSCKKHYCGAYGCAHRTEKKAILYWNTRPVPPLGRCVECANSPDIETRTKGMRWCRNFRSEVKPDGFCNSFAAKE